MAEFKYPYGLHLGIVVGWFVLEWFLFGAEGPIVQFLQMSGAFAKMYNDALAGSTHAAGTLPSMQNLLFAVLAFILKFAVYYILIGIVILIVLATYRVAKHFFTKT
jgi:hypothetical protein